VKRKRWSTREKTKRSHVRRKKNRLLREKKKRKEKEVFMQNKVITRILCHNTIPPSLKIFSKNPKTSRNSKKKMFLMYFGHSNTHFRLLDYFLLLMFS